MLSKFETKHLLSISIAAGVPMKEFDFHFGVYYIPTGLQDFYGLRNWNYKYKVGDRVIHLFSNPICCGIFHPQVLITILELLLSSNDELLRSAALMEIHPVTLVGQTIRLEPLSLVHVPDLAQVGLDNRIWQFMVYGEMHTEEDIRLWVKEMLARQSRNTDLPFAVVSIASKKAIGATRFMEIQPLHRSLEIGGTWYGLNYQGGIVNAEAKYLLLSYAFERLAVLRVQLKTDCTQPAISESDRKTWRSPRGRSPPAYDHLGWSPP